MATVSTLSSFQAAQARGEYQTALDFYNKRQYGPAATYFEAASLVDPSNVAANYYAGYCFYTAGRRDEAIKSFWRLARAYPTRREGYRLWISFGRSTPTLLKTRPDRRSRGRQRQPLAAQLKQLEAKAPQTAGTPSFPKEQLSTPWSRSNRQLANCPMSPWPFRRKSKTCLSRCHRRCCR